MTLPAVNLVTDKLLLAAEAEIISIREFPSEVQAQLDEPLSDHILSLAGSRLSSERVNDETAAFLKGFSSPARFVDVVAAFADKTNEDPHELLPSLYPIVRRLVESGVLKTDGESDVGQSTLGVGDRIDGFQIKRPARLISDTSVFVVEWSNGDVAIAKFVDNPELLERERDILEFLHKSVPGLVPAVLGQSLQGDRPYLLLEHLEGETLWAFLSRRRPFSERLVRASAVLRAYADLHEQSVLHGDVQPTNVILSPDGAARLIDFGAACMPGLPSGPRAGLVPYFEPELASAIAGGSEPPPPTPAGEQYAVAVLTQHLLTNEPYLSLNLERDAALRQVMTAKRKTLGESGVDWPAGNRVLERALRKRPSLRYKSMRTFERRFCQELSSEGRSAATRSTPRSSLLNDHVEFFLASVEGDEPPKLRAPKASIYHGAGGVAWAMLRLACLRGDESLLASADRWLSLAQENAGRATAFAAPEIGLDQAAIGSYGLLHSIAGLRLADALISYSIGDIESTAGAVTSYSDLVDDALKSVSEMASPTPWVGDMTTGLASLLLGAAVLFEALPQDLTAARLAGAASSLRFAVSDELRQPDVEARCDHYLGLAHGISGPTFALLRFAAATETLPDEAALTSLDRLAGIGDAETPGWPIRRASRERWVGWCHGSAGYLLLWITASQAVRDERYLDLASAAATDIWNRRRLANASLCCGLAGCSIALLQLAEMTGESRWSARARSLARIVAKHSDQLPIGLFRGRAGCAVAVAESLHLQVLSPVMPLCGSPI